MIHTSDALHDTSTGEPTGRIGAAVLGLTTAIMSPVSRRIS
jgi:hypothetical protein